MLAQKQWSRGHAAGHAEGVVEGRRASLTKLVTLKFGPPGERAALRIAAGTVEELDAWIERVLTARTADEVFGSE